MDCNWVMVVFLLFSMPLAWAEPKRPAAEPLDEPTVKRCRRLIELHEEGVEELRKISVASDQILEKGLPDLKAHVTTVLESSWPRLNEDLKEIVSRYVSEYQRLSVELAKDPKVDEEGRKKTLLSLTKIMTPLILRRLDGNGIGFQYYDPLNFYGKSTYVSDSIEGTCHINDGKVLVCYRCAKLRKLGNERDPSLENRMAYCTPEFQLDLNSGRVTGLESPKDQAEFVAGLNKIRKEELKNHINPFKADLIKAENGEGLEPECLAVWRSDQAAANADAKPIVNNGALHDEAKKSSPPSDGE